jgi:hypothetical protein
MGWLEALKVGAVVIASLGGGGAIVLGLSGFLGQVWMQRLKGDIDARLQRLDAALTHQNFLLQRFAELELEAITECWRAAWACTPLLNATRPHDSGTDEAQLLSNTKLLGEAHNALLAAVGRHEPFLPTAILENLENIRQVVALELSNIGTYKHFEGEWWAQGARNQERLKTLTDSLVGQVRARTAQLREEGRATG